MIAKSRAVVTHTPKKLTALIVCLLPPLHDFSRPHRYLFKDHGMGSLLHIKTGGPKASGPHRRGSSYAISIEDLQAPEK